MPKVKEIQNGNYCENCSWECRHFNRDADCCDCDTFVGRIYSQFSDPEYLNKEMKFEMR